MATTNSVPIAGGNKTLKQDLSLNGNMGLKGMISNAPDCRGSAGSAEVESEDDEASGDSSANEGCGGTGEADVQALSGVATLTMEPSARLAGKAMDIEMLSDDDESMADDGTASAGAATSQGGDDEDYSGLAALSDDGQSLQGDGEDELLKAAETDLIREFEQKEEKARTHKALEDSFWLANGFLDDDENLDTDSIGDDLLSAQNPPNLDEDPFGGVELFNEEWKDMALHAESHFLWEGSLLMDPPISRPKRVRFEEGARLSRSPSNSSSDSSDDEPDSHFPDIFMDQEDPKIQQLLAYDFTDGDVGGGSDTGSVYDFEDDGDKFVFEADQDSESSEYDTDSETEDGTDDDIDYETEDESLEEQKAKMLEIRRASRANSTVSAPVTPTKSASSKPTTTPLARSHSNSKSSSPKSRKGPKMGTFALDPTKATVVSDDTGRTTVLYMPSQPSEKHKAFWDRAKSAASSRASSPRGSMSMALPSHGSKESIPQRPLTVQSTLATMFDGNMDFMRANEITPQPAEIPQAAFVPILSSFNSIAATDDGSDELDEDFTMLIDMDPESDTDVPSPGGDTSDAAPVKVAPTFFTHGTVGSFRLNQHRARQESSLASHPDSRASTSEQNALQSGRRGAGNAPITPARKKRVSKDLTRTGSGVRKPTTPAMSSPLASRRSRGQSLSGRLDQTLAPGFSMWQ